MRPRIVFAYRYASPGGPVTQLLARLELFASHFDVRMLFEWDLGGVSLFPPDIVTVAPSFQSQVDAIAELKPDVFVVIDSGWREPWIRAGSPGKLVMEVHTTTANLTFLDELRAAQRIDLFICASKYLASLLAERGLGDIAPIAVVPNTLRSGWVEKADPWDAPAPILLWIGRLEPHKGVRRFIALCDALDEQNVNPFLHAPMIAFMAELQGERVRLRPLGPHDVGRLTEIGAEPEVARWWGEITREHLLDKAEWRDDATAFAIEHEGEVVGLAQFSEPGENEFKHANIDLFLASSLHGRGLGRDAVRTLARWLIDERGHHRLTIDPALANEAAIRAYEAVGFKRIGVLARQTKTDVDLVWINRDAARDERDLVEPVGDPRFSISTNPHSHN